MGLADRLAGCLKDPRASERTRHTLAEIIRFRMMLIAAGYEDGIDADALRRDPMFKLALGRLPSGADLCSPSTVSRLENPGLRRGRLCPIGGRCCGSPTPLSSNTAPRSAPCRSASCSMPTIPPLSRGQAF